MVETLTQPTSKPSLLDKDVLNLEEFESLNSAEAKLPLISKDVLSLEEVQSIEESQGKVALEEDSPEKALHRTMNGKDRNFFQNIGESFKVGNEGANISEISHSALIGNVDMADVMLINNDYIRRISEDPVEGNNWLSNAVYSVAGMLPAMGKGMIEGAGIGAVAATGAVIAGQAGPQVLAPEELVTVPTAFSFGSTVGSMNYWYRQGSGEIYLDLKKNEIDDGVAKPIAHLAGAMYGAVEFSQVFKLIPGAKQATKQLITGSVRKVVGNLIKRHGVNWLQEVSEEILQEEIKFAAEEIALRIEGKTNKGVGTLARKALKIGVNTFNETAIPMLLLLAPVAGVDAKNAIGVAKELKAAEKQIAEAEALFAEVEKVEPQRKAGEIVRDEQGAPIEINAEEEVNAEVKQEVKTPKSTKLGSYIDSKLQEEIDKEGRRLDELEIAEVDQRAVEDIISEMEGNKINKSKNADIKEELQPIPSRFASTNRNAQAADEVLQNLKDRGFLPEESTTSDLVEFLVDTNERQKQIKQEIKDLKPKIIAQRETTVFKNKVKNIKRGFRRGVVATKETIRNRMDAVNELLADLDLRDQGKFRKTPKKITEGDISNDQKFEQLLADIEDRVARLKEAAERRSLKSKITTNLKRSRPKLSSKKLKGKFTPAIQDLLDNIRSHSKLTQPQAAALLSERLNSDIVSTSQDAFENTFLAYQSGDPNVSLQNIQSLNETIEGLMAVGKEASAAKLTKEQEELQALKDEINAYNAEKRDIKEERKLGLAATLRDVPKVFRNLISELSDGWDDVLDRILPEKLALQLEVGAEIQKEKGLRRVWKEKFLSNAMEAFELNENETNKKLESDGKVEDLGVFINEAGEEVVVQVSKAQARKLWIETQDPTLDETLRSEKGNAYTQEMLNTMFTLLDAKDYAFARKQMEMYQDIYEMVNPVYARVFGINLPRNLFHSPIRREVDSGDLNVDEFLRDVNYRAQVSSVAFKIRDPRAISPLMLRSDVQVFSRHINEMSRFIAMREKTQLLNSIFKDKKIRREIQKIHGEEATKIIDDHIDSFVKGGIQSANLTEAIINILNRNYAVSQLAGKVKIGATQFVSHSAYLEFMSAKDFAKGTGDFFLNFKEAIEILGATETMQNRGASIEADISRMGKTFNNEFLQKVQNKQDSIMDHLMFFIRFGDRAPIYAGGWALYKAELKKTGSKKKALATFERVTNKTQQSKDLDQLSTQQKSNPLMRTFTLFMSAPIAQFRGEVRAFRKLSKGEFTKAQFAKSILIYHFIIPQLYQLVANAFIWDDDDQSRAAMLGSLNGIPILGDIMNVAFRRAQGKRAFLGDGLKWARPLYDIADNSLEGLIALLEGDLEAVWEAIKDLSNPAGQVTGLPTPQAENIEKATKDFNNGRGTRGTARSLGWPDSVVKKIK